MNRYFLLTGPRTALIEFFLDLTGYDHTQLVSTDGVSMVWIKERIPGSTDPELPSGITVLGNRYDEIWADAPRLAAYNAVFAPDETGGPRPFGVFAGCGEEMGL